MHLTLSWTDWLNLATLAGIFVANLAILGLISRRTATDSKVGDVYVAHAFWTANWLIWFFAWILHFKTTSLILPDLVNDLGSFCLIAFALAFGSGVSKLKSHWVMLAGFLVMDVVWLGGASVAVPQCVRAISAPTMKDWIASLGVMPPENFILHRTVVFGPSLCLVIFALGLVAWSFIERFGQWQLSGLMALLTAAYAVLQVVFYETTFIMPALPAHRSVEVLFLAWRVILVLLYSFLILSCVGIQIQFQRVVAVLGTAGSVVSTIVALRSFIFGK